MRISRRDVLKLGAGAVLAGSANQLLAGRGTREKKIPIALQLYSVRKQCAEDLPGVLKAVAKMGYHGVEFAGYHGRSAKELRKMLDDNGLHCCGTHTRLDTLTGDAMKGTVEFNKTLGNPYLIVPGMPHKMKDSVEAVKKTAALFDELAAKAKPLDMKIGYHAHGGDFTRLGDQTAWDLLFSSTSSDVIMQLDIGNCIGGGGDPIAILKKFPGRSPTIHLKEHGGKPGAAVGDGDVDWKTIFKLCETTGGTKWYIVEHESAVASPLAAVKLCLDNLHKMGK